MVHDETRCVLGINRFVAHLLGIVAQSCANAGVGFKAGNDFHHFHQGNGVEEVITSELLWALEGCSDCCDRKGRCIRYQDCARVHQLFEFSKE